MATVASHSDIAQFVPDYSAQFLSELQGILEKAQRFSGATGAAIAFVEGEELVTKSGLGASAPEVGSRSPIQGSFTGLCVQTREVQRCDDASHDSRVDGQACAALGVASMVIVPIGEKSKTFGVLAAFASKANAFTPTHVALLRTLADIVVELYNRYPATNAAAKTQTAAPEVKPEAPKPPVSAKPEPPQVAVPPVAHATVKPATSVVSRPAPVASAPKPVASSVAPSSIKLTEAPVIVPPVKMDPPVIEAKKEVKPPVQRSEPLRVERKPEPQRFAPVIDIDAARERKEEVLSSAADIGPVVVSKAAASSSINPRIGMDSAPLFSSYNSSALSALEQQQRADTGSKRMLFVVALLVIVAASAAGGYFFTRKPAKANSETAKVTQPAESAPAPVNPAPETSQPAATTSAPVKNPAPVEPAPVQTKPAVKEHVVEPAPVKKSEPAPLMVANSGSIPKHVGENVDAPTVITGAGSDVGGILGMVKTAQPKAAFRASQVTPPELIRRVAPIYPAFARQWHLKSERVVLNATIGKDGAVTDVKLVRGKQIFVDAAMNAVRQWKYKPAYLNSEPVPASIEIALDFTN